MAECLVSTRALQTTAQFVTENSMILSNLLIGLLVLLLVLAPSRGRHFLNRVLGDDNHGDLWGGLSGPLLVLMLHRLGRLPMRFMLIHDGVGSTGFDTGGCLSLAGDLTVIVAGTYMRSEYVCPADYGEFRRICGISLFGTVMLLIGLTDWSPQPTPIHGQTVRQWGLTFTGKD
jgi:hypothetical protein